MPQRKQEPFAKLLTVPGSVRQDTHLTFAFSPVTFLVRLSVKAGLASSPPCATAGGPSLSP